VFNKQLLIFAHQLGDRSFYPIYQHLIKNQWRPYAELKDEQETQFRHIISFAYENFPYYHILLTELNLFPKDIHTIEDLEKLPLSRNKSSNNIRKTSSRSTSHQCCTMNRQLVDQLVLCSTIDCRKTTGV